MSDTAVAPNSCQRYVYNCANALDTTFSDSDGVKKSSELIASTLEAIGHFFIKVQESLQHLVTKIRHFINLTTCLSLCKRIRAWVSPNSEGKMLWEQQWQSLPSIAALSVANTIDFLILLDTFKLIALGAAYIPLNMLTYVLTAFSYAIDTSMYADTARDFASKEKLALKRKEKWNSWKQRIQKQAVLPQTWHDHVQNKIDKWAQRISTGTLDQEKLKKAVDKKSDWEALQNLGDRASVIKACSEKAEKWSEAKRSAKIDKIKYWIYVISCAASTVLILLGCFVQPYVSGGLLGALLLANVGNNALDLTSYLLDFLWK